VRLRGQIFNLDNGGEIEEKANKDRALGRKIAEIQRGLGDVVKMLKCFPCKGETVEWG